MTRSGGNPDIMVIPEVTTMAEMLDCLVTFFSENTNAEGLPRRYLSYHVIAGPPALLRSLLAGSHVPQPDRRVSATPTGCKRLAIG